MKNFKKREALHRLLVKLNDIEGEADQIFAEGMYELFASEVNSHTPKVVFDF